MISVIHICLQNFKTVEGPKWVSKWEILNVQNADNNKKIQSFSLPFDKDYDI